MSTDEPRTVEAVHKACAIVRVLRDRDGLSVTEIADSVDFSKSTVHGHLATLVDEGFVVREGDRYRLGFEFVEVGTSVIESRVVDLEAIRDEVQRLADETGEQVRFVVEEDGYVACIDRREGDEAIRHKFGIGDRMPMHSTATGKAILAEYPAETVEGILERRGLPERTEHTITDAATLYEHLEAVDAQGFAIDDGESIPGMRAVGTAVTIPERRVLGALGVSGPSTRMTDDRIERELQTQIAQAANVIEVDSIHS